MTGSRIRGHGEYQSEEEKRLQRLLADIFRRREYPLGPRKKVTLLELEKKYNRLKKEYDQLVAIPELPRWLLDDAEFGLLALWRFFQGELLRAAFYRFVELIRPIWQVRYAVALNGERPDMFSFINEMDPHASEQVHKAEYQILEEFPRIEIEFHIIYLEGRPLEDFIRSSAELVFSRE